MREQDQPDGDRQRPAGGRYEAFALTGMPEVRAGADLVVEIVRAIEGMGEDLRDQDVLVVAQKIVSKSEGRIYRLEDVVPGAEAIRLAEEQGKDPRVVELVLRETRRIVRAKDGVIIVETHHGFVCANAGIDRSNAGAPDTVVLLPRDPDASAARLRRGLLEATGTDVGVVITDTFGRAWREGQTNVAIGMSGLEPFIGYDGQRDPDDHELRITQMAIGDELAAAGELVMGKLLRQPAAVIRGMRMSVADGGVSRYIRPAERDLFR